MKRLGHSVIAALAAVTFFVTLVTAFFTGAASLPRAASFFFAAIAWYVGDHYAPQFTRPLIMATTVAAAFALLRATALSASDSARLLGT